MPFDVQTITYKGAQLLADATAADKLIIDGCDATAVALTEDQALAVTTRPASPLSNTTEVTQLGSTAEHVQTRVYFHAGVSAGGDANTLYLYGHTESAPTDLFVIFVCSSTASFHLPEVGDVIDEWQTDIDIVYTVATDSVGFATQATYCSLSEFNLLKNRTVTTHKEGDTTTGDAQTILGEKTFSNAVILSQSITPTTTNTVDVGSSTKLFKDAYFAGTMNAGLVSTTILVPVSTNMTDVGNSLLKFKDGWFSGTVHTNKVSISGNISTTITTCDIGTSSNKFQNAYFSGTVNAGSISVAGHITPTISNTDDIGSSTYLFGSGYFGGTVYTSQLSTLSSLGSILLGNNIVPNTAGTICLGNSTYEFGDGYFSGYLHVKHIDVRSGATNGIAGIDPVYNSNDYTLSIPIGGIVMVSVTNDNIGSFYDEGGTAITGSLNGGVRVQIQQGSTNVSKIRMAIYDDSNQKWEATAGPVLPNGWYRTLSGILSSISSGHTVTLLLQKIT